MPEGNNKNGKKLSVTKWQVSGMIAVAILGAWTTYTNTQSASDNELKKTTAKQEAIIEDLKKNVIPSIQQGFDKLNQDLTELKEDEAAARERIAKLEGIIEALLRKVKINDIIVPPFSSKSEDGPGLLKVLGLGKEKEKKPKRKRIRIPTLQTQQRVLPSLDSPISNKEKRDD
jgi:flagellar basal body-associated protein FliL